jgi:hypothetical protein
MPGLSKEEGRFSRRSDAIHEFENGERPARLVSSNRMGDGRTTPWAKALARPGGAPGFESEADRATLDGSRDPGDRRREEARPSRVESSRGALDVDATRPGRSAEPGISRRSTPRDSSLRPSFARDPNDRFVSSAATSRKPDRGRVSGEPEPSTRSTSPPRPSGRFAEFQEATVGSLRSELVKPTMSGTSDPDETLNHCKRNSCGVNHLSYQNRNCNQPVGQVPKSRPIRQVTILTFRRSIVLNRPVRRRRNRTGRELPNRHNRGGHKARRGFASDRAARAGSRGPGDE